MVWLLALWLLATAGLAPAQSWAQKTPPATDEDETEDNSEFALTFSRAAGAPGEEVALPVYFTRRPGAPNVEKLTLRLSYPKSVVIYNKAEDAYLSRRAGAISMRSQRLPANKVFWKLASPCRTLQSRTSPAVK